jgi:hypothetical protein
MKKWVKALRSKKYKQGQRALKIKTKAGTVKHCCLGVLCELYQKESNKKLQVTNRKVEKDEDLPQRCSVYSFAKNDTGLPGVVMRWAGMKTDDGWIEGNRHVTLACMNDDGCSFEKIADTIEDRFKDI